MEKILHLLIFVRIVQHNMIPNKKDLITGMPVVVVVVIIVVIIIIIIIIIIVITDYNPSITNYNHFNSFSK